MHLCGHSSIKFLWSCDTRVQDSFFLLSQPSVSKTCSFINSCIHPSPFSVFGKIFTAFTLQVYTHFFQKLVMISEFFQRKVGSHLFSKACWFFSLTTYFFFFLLLFFYHYHLFISFSCLFFFLLFFS